jgi:cytochrome c oxidase assembly protein subunit 15
LPHYNRAHHAFALFLACAAFLLLIAGGLVTSHDAGLSVPDWPTSFGTFHMPRMVGGVMWEHGHRMIAATVGLLTIVLAVWTWMVDPRRWMRVLTAVAVLGVVLQGVLGGLTVLNFLPPAISTGHAVLGQTMFCVLAAIALFTSQSWYREPGITLTPRDAARLRKLSAWLIVVLYVQLTLGAAFRHVWTKWGPEAAHRWDAPRIVQDFMVPHMINALLVILFVVLTTVLVFRRCVGAKQLRVPAILLHVLLLAQLLLGPAAFFVRVLLHMDRPQPAGALVAVTVAHLAMGALMLAVAIILAIQVRRIAEREEPRAVRAPGTPEVVSA